MKQLRRSLVVQLVMHDETAACILVEASALIGAYVAQAWSTCQPSLRSSGTIHSIRTL